MISKILNLKILILGITIPLMSCGDGGGDGGGVKVDLSSSPTFNAVDPSGYGKVGIAAEAGSKPRFATLENRLYAPSEGGLTTFDISNPKEPTKVGSIPVSGNIKSLFLDGKRLYISTENTLYIYSLESPDKPIQLGEFIHKESNTPLVASGPKAYFTTHSGKGWPQGGKENQLYTLDVTLAGQIKQISSFPMGNPQGLAIVGHRLFVCDGTNGLVELNVENPNSVAQVGVVADEICLDVILLEKILVVSGSLGVTQYDLLAPNLKRLSRIETTSIVSPIPASKN